MSISSILSFSAGIFAAKYYPIKRPITVGLLGATTLFYTGSMLEWDNLVALQPIKPYRPGFWAICGGMSSLGLITGGLFRQFDKKFSSKFFMDVFGQKRVFSLPFEKTNLLKNHRFI
ncbi:hypothetical protein M153_2500010065 [Pseudoloma neurophilia]|uniref:Uncharacterized protein n=1 Tax=Pseudoloma neurophilia TaxID=146866 RepID=A0A0R0M0R6_9MICR|nr:hypothetical protein M153_2500010065 [Pseudoloma neurophilia]